MYVYTNIACEINTRTYRSSNAKGKIMLPGTFEYS